MNRNNPKQVAAIARRLDQVVPEIAAKAWEDTHGAVMMAKKKGRVPRPSAGVFFCARLCSDHRREAVLV